MTEPVEPIPDYRVTDPDVLAELRDNVPLMRLGPVVVPPSD